MINANKELLNTFFSSNLQFVIPFFQRSYVWNKENWENLWEHINNIREKGNNGKKPEHFIGTLITKQQQKNDIGENKLDLIDGQQRLTTIALIFKAIAVKATGQPPYARLKDKVNELLIFENARGESFIRIEHSQNDRKYFEAIIYDLDWKQLPVQDHRILEAYKFFIKKLKDYTDEQLTGLYTTILNNVPVISMLLAFEDDEQEIFDTINSLGVRLTTGELLKNYIFSDEKIRLMFEVYWRSVFEEDEEQVDFWNKEKTAGRITRTNIEVLLYCYLIIQTKNAVGLEKLFSQYKSWLKDKTVEEKKTILTCLKDYAAIYSAFPEGRELDNISFGDGEKRFFHIIDRLEITTIYPLILYLYMRIKDVDAKLGMLKVLECYLIRRNVCRLTTKNYNNLFIQIIVKLEEQEIVSVDSLKALLLEFTEDTNRYPRDEEFRMAFSEETLSNSNAREILFCIALYDVSNSLSDLQTLNSNIYTAEHMMPQKWETYWNHNGMNEAEKIIRNKKIKTLGNLTLVTGKMNSSMKNAAWETKKATLRDHSHLRITTDYLNLKDWNEDRIHERANDLAAISLEIWN